jgi:hypothetical protein
MQLQTRDVLVKRIPASSQPFGVTPGVTNMHERRRPALAQATHPTQRHFNGSSTLVRDRGRMTTRWTFRLARVWAACPPRRGHEDDLPHPIGVGVEMWF